MNSHNDRPHANLLTRASLFVCAGLAIVAMSVGLGTSAADEMPVMNANGSLVMDAAVFGSSAGQASIKSAPTTWSSWSRVRFNARCANDARYVV